MAVIADDYIFVHVPKCAGHSIMKALRKPVERSIPHHVPRLAIPFDERPAFGFIRDPWARMSSLYYYLWRSPERHNRRVDAAELKAIGFKRWLLEGNTYMSHEPHPDGMVWTRQSQHYGPDVTYPGLDIVAADTDLPPMQRRPVMRQLEGCDYVGKVETLQRDLAVIAGAIGIKVGNLGRENVTRDKPDNWRDEYDIEMIDHVAHYFKDDIAQGGYAWN